MLHNKYLLPRAAKNHKNQLLSPELSNPWLIVPVFNLHPKDIRVISHSPIQHCVVHFLPQSGGNLLLVCCEHLLVHSDTL